MTSKDKIAILKRSFEDTIWMAIRYAHGRHTYAPSMVRDAIEEYRKVFPDWEPQADRTIEPPMEAQPCYGLRGDWLDDLFEERQGQPK